MSNQTVSQRRALNNLVMRDQKDRPSVRRHEVNINQHCVDDYYLGMDGDYSPMKNVLIGVAIGLCSSVIAIVFFY